MILSNLLWSTGILIVLYVVSHPNKVYFNLPSLFLAAPPLVRGIPGGGACGVFYSACYLAFPPPGWWWVCDSSHCTKITKRVGKSPMKPKLIYGWLVGINQKIRKDNVHLQRPNFHVYTVKTWPPQTKQRKSMSESGLTALLLILCTRLLFVNELLHKHDPV